MSIASYVPARDVKRYSLRKWELVFKVSLHCVSPHCALAHFQLKNHQKNSRVLKRSSKNSQICSAQSCGLRSKLRKLAVKCKCLWLNSKVIQILFWTQYNEEVVRSRRTHRIICVSVVGVDKKTRITGHLGVFSVRIRPFSLYLFSILFWASSQCGVFLLYVGFEQRYV